MSWINTLKVAIIEEDFTNISKVLQEMPKFDNLEEATEALALIKGATKLAISEKQKILEAMNKIKKTKKFLEH